MLWHREDMYPAETKQSKGLAARALNYLWGSKTEAKAAPADAGDTLMFPGLHEPPVDNASLTIEEEDDDEEEKVDEPSMEQLSADATIDDFFPAGTVEERIIKGPEDGPVVERQCIGHYKNGKKCPAMTMNPSGFCGRKQGHKEDAP